MADRTERAVRHGIYEGDGLLAVCSVNFAGLYRLWDAKRAGRMMPSRRDFDPAEMKTWLGRVNLLDVLPGPPPMDFRYRLCGTRTVTEYGIDLTGRKFSEGVYIGTPDEARAAMTEFVRVGRARYRNDPLTDKHGYAIMRERMYLPLSDDGSTINIILCYQESKVLVPAPHRPASAQDRA